MLMVGQAIDAYQDVPVQEAGDEFLHNSWGMGPFYAWDANFLAKQKNKKNESL